MAYGAGSQEIVILPQFFAKTCLLLILMLLCLGASAPGIPLTIKQETRPIKFGQTYQELSKTWKLTPFAEDEYPFFLLYYGVVARSEVKLFDKPFLCRFYFDKPTPRGRLIAIDLVHWEKGHNRRARKAEEEFTTAIQKAYGQQKPKVSQKDKQKIISYNWPGVEFNNQHDEGGQTWYVTFSQPGLTSPLLEGLPLGKAKSELDKALGLEPYYEPDAPLPTIPGHDYHLNLSCSPLALRTYYIFADYSPKAPLVGVKMILPDQSVASWLNCRMEQLQHALQLKYGKPAKVKANHFVWKNRQASLTLRQADNKAWVLEYLSNNIKPPSQPNENHPPNQPDITGWERLQWNMSPSRALNLYPQMPKTAYARAGGQGSFFVGQTQVNDITHQLRLSFGNLGLEEISLNYASPVKGSSKQQENMKAFLEKQYGPSDWQHTTTDEVTYHWAKAGGYLEFTIFKEPAPSWRMVFKPRQPMVK